jgi:hypothetical protein
MTVRRIRGSILRLVRRRLAAILIGALLVAAALWLKLKGDEGGWWEDGLSLILGATGAAVLWTGLVGIRPDWIDQDE